MLIRVNEDGTFLKAENVAMYYVRKTSGNVWRAIAVSKGMTYTLGEFDTEMEADQALNQLFLELGEHVVQVMSL